MTVTISRLYDSYAEATEAVTNLENAGVPQSDISIVSNNSDNWYSENNVRRTTRGGPATVDRDRDGVDDRAEGAATGAGIGATAGGVVGLLTGLGLMAIPGVGPVVAAGWLVATAAGAAVGGTAGGIVGALTQAGTSEEDAYVYAEGVRRGGTLVSARVADADRARYEAILDRRRTLAGHSIAASRPGGSNLEKARRGRMMRRCEASGTMGGCAPFPVEGVIADGDEQSAARLRAKAQPA
jgi:hypothetical protein